MAWPKKQNKTEGLVTTYNTFGVQALFHNSDLGNLYHLPPTSKLNVKRERNFQKRALPFQNYSLYSKIILALELIAYFISLL